MIAASYKNGYCMRNKILARRAKRGRIAPRCPKPDRGRMEKAPANASCRKPFGCLWRRTGAPTPRPRRKFLIGAAGSFAIEETAKRPGFAFPAVTICSPFLKNSGRKADAFPTEPFFSGKYRKSSAHIAELDFQAPRNGFWHAAPPADALMENGRLQNSSRAPEK